MKMMNKKTRSINTQMHIRLIKLLPVVSMMIGASVRAADKTLIDYFQPMPITDSLSKDVWGTAEVGPRDPKNGLEDTTMKQWCYWDGQIIKAPDGKFHMFASRWDQAKGHNEWWNSKAVHAVSDKVTGPYIDKGLCWPDDQGGKGHCVTALVLPDGRYAVVISETRPGTVFVSKSLDGPWEQLGTIKLEGLDASNISIMVRPDGDYMIVPRSGLVFISKAADGILGPYKSMGPSAFPGDIPVLEDPAIFYSGGLYHIIVNSCGPRKAYHLTSKDGKSNWVNRGLAYDPTTDFARYTDGTVNHWHKLERPGVLIENGHVTAITLAALDTPKEEQPGNNGHGSKIIVIPFDGAALDRDLQNAAKENPAPGSPAQLKWQDGSGRCRTTNEKIR
ncbi:MAG: glycoside hydrolase family protein [Verrucomicrobia bacterium]|nr:glycoside hydrolase family protein [Verrucomicrobiota bacterium]